MVIWPLATENSSIYVKEICFGTSFFQALSRSAPTLDRKPSLTWGHPLQELVGKSMVSIPVKQVRISQKRPENQFCVVFIA